MTDKEMLGCIFSISTESHLAQAKALFDSARDRLPDGESGVDFVLFCVDMSEAQVRLYQEKFLNTKLIAVEQIITTSFLENLKKRYTDSELCWSLKAVLAKFVLNYYQYVFYIDGDVMFYSNPKDMLRLFDGKAIVLTPHYLNSFSFTGQVNSLALLKSGVFNAGFLGCMNTPEAHKFLDWWAIQCFFYGKNDPKSGMCGDQRWLDLVPVLFSESLSICKDEGVNVGHWNIHERTISKESDTYFSNSHRLLFFHFSGFDVEKPHLLSRHRLISNQGDTPLLLLQENYAQAVKDAVEVLSTVKRESAWKFGKWFMFSTADHQSGYKEFIARVKHYTSHNESYFSPYKSNIDPKEVFQ